MNKFFLAVLPRIPLSVVDKTSKGIPNIESHKIFIDVSIIDPNHDYQRLCQQRYISCTNV